MPCPVFDVIRFVIALMVVAALFVSVHQIGGWLAVALVALLFVIAIPWQLQWWQEEEKRRQRGNY